MYVNKLSQRSRERLARTLKQSNGQTYKPLPDNWLDFVRLTKIRSGNKILTFEPYSYQRDLVDVVESNYGTVAVKSRQMGFTQCIASLFAFKACVNPAYTALILSKNQQDTAKVAERIREMLNCLKDYVDTENDSKLHIKIKNGGQIYFRNSKIDGARGIDSVSDVLFDEAGFIDDIDAIYSAVLPCTEMVGDDAKIVILSTPNGQSGFYWDKLINNAKAKDFIGFIDDIRTGEIDPVQYYSKDSWATFITHWKAHPIYSQKENYLETLRDKKQISWEKVLQEYDLSFVDNEISVFSTDVVRNCVDTAIKPGEGSRYIGIDTSGLGDDYTVATVIECGDDGIYRVIDLYRKRKQTSDYNIYQISQLIEKHKPENVGIEITGGTGQIYLEQLVKLCVDIDFTAIRTTYESKPQMIDRLKLAMEKQQIKFSDSSPIVSELLTFRRRGKKLEAVSGKHDDTVMSLAFAITVSPLGLGKEKQLLFKVG